MSQSKRPKIESIPWNFLFVELMKEVSYKKTKNSLFFWKLGKQFPPVFEIM